MADVTMDLRHQTPRQYAEAAVQALKRQGANDLDEELVADYLEVAILEAARRARAAALTEVAAVPVPEAAAPNSTFTAGVRAMRLHILAALGAKPAEKE